jgi:hypothetical protein
MESGIFTTIRHEVIEHKGYKEHEGMVEQR